MLRNFLTTKVRIGIQVMTLLLAPVMTANSIHRDFSTVTVTGTTETLVFSFFLPANILSTNRGVRIVMWGDYINNSGANSTMTVRIRLGATAGITGTVVVTKTSDNIASAAVTGAFWSELAMFNVAATNVQRGALLLQPDRGASGRVTIAGTGTAAVDTTADLFLSVTVQHSTAGTTLNKQGAQATLL